MQQDDPTHLDVQRLHCVFHIFWRERTPFPSYHELFRFLHDEMYAVFDISSQRFCRTKREGVERETLGDFLLVSGVQGLCGSAPAIASALLVTASKFIAGHDDTSSRVDS